MLGVEGHGKGALTVFKRLLALHKLLTYVPSQESETMQAREEMRHCLEELLLQIRVGTREKLKFANFNIHKSMITALPP